MAGVLSDNHKFLLPCPATPLIAVCQFCLNCGYSWYSASLGMCVFYGQEGKGIGDKGMAGELPSLPSLVLSPFLHRSSPLSVGRKVAREALRGHGASSVLSK